MSGVLITASLYAMRLHVPINGRASMKMLTSTVRRPSTAACGSLFCVQSTPKALIPAQSAVCRNRRKQHLSSVFLTYF